MNKILELKQKAYKAVKDGRALIDKADSEKRSMTAEEKTNYDKAFADANAYRDEAALLERQVALEKELSEPEARRTASEKPGAAGPEAREVEHRKAFMKWLVTGNDTELRAMSADTAGEGGNVIPQAFAKEILVGLDNSVFMRAISDVLPAIPGAVSLGAPYMSVDASDAEWTTEIVGAAADDSLAVGKRTLQPQLLCKLVKASKKFLQISAAGEAFIKSRINAKMSAAMENGYLNGSGSAQPLGVFYASSNGVPTSRDMATDNTGTAFTADGLINNKYNVKAQYRKSAQWIMSRAAVKMASKLKDGEGRYLWLPSLLAGKPDTLLGDPINESEYAPSTFTTGLYVAIYGDFKYYQIVDSINMEIQRLVELYAATHQDGFIPRLWTDGQPVLAEAFSRVKLG